MKKRIKIIFTLSLLTNLILIGFFVGGYLKHARWENHLPHNVSPETREILKENMKASWEEMRLSFREMRVKKEKLKDIINAEEFDLAAYDLITREILNDKNEIGHRKAIAIGKTLAELPLEDRKAISEKIVRGITSAGQRGKKDYKRDNRHHQGTPPSQKEISE